jgi:hypothetical protein
MKRVRLVVDLTMRFGPKEDDKPNACCCVVKVKANKEKLALDALVKEFADEG